MFNLFSLAFVFTYSKAIVIASTFDKYPLKQPTIHKDIPTTNNSMLSDLIYRTPYYFSFLQLA